LRQHHRQGKSIIKELRNLPEEEYANIDNVTQAKPQLPNLRDVTRFPN